MSSILDALNKVEREQIEEDEIINGEVDAATAARYLYGSAARKRHGGARRRLFRWKTATGAAVMIVLTAAVAAALVMLGVIPPAMTSMIGEPAPSHGTPPGPADATSVAPQTSTELQPTVGEVNAEGHGAAASIPDAPVDSAPLEEGFQPLDAQAPQPGPLAKAPSDMASHVPVPGVAEAPPQHHAPPMVEHPEIPRDYPPTPQVAPPRQDAPAPPSGAEALPEDLNIRSLPRLTPSEQARLGLPRLEVMLVGMPGDRRPRPSAMINFNKVFVKEYVPNTNVRLVAVDIRGVAVEHNGRFYFLPVRG